jgi:two-component system, NtrC family, sensor histidine kinase HydH
MASAAVMPLAPHAQNKTNDRAAAIFEERRGQVLRRVDKMFLVLMIVQWVAAILVALFVSPYGWEGKVRAVHFHVYVAVLLGGALSLFPIALIVLRPGSTLTRHVVAASQMLWSALLIHLSGGRIETHFHVFGSLAFIGFYLDWKVIPTATTVVAGDHFIRGLLWPESVYGITNPEWWRFLEHAFWVLFTDVFIVLSCLNGMRDLHSAARQQAEVETLAEKDELQSLALEMVLQEVKDKA